MKTILFITVVFISFFYCDKVYAINNIKINNEFLSPYFDSDIYVYNYYTYSDKVDIVVTNEKDEQITGSGIFEIKDGENVFEITSQINNISKKYILHVYKNYKKNNNKSSYLKSLNIKDYEILFDKEKLNYDININDEDELDINYETEENNAKVIITGNSNFNSANNQINIKVVSSNKEETVYKINVHKTVEVFNEINNIKKSYTLSSNQKKIIITCIIIISYIILSGLFRVLFLKKNSLNILRHTLQK